MGLKYGDALRDVTLDQIIWVINTDETFKWCNAAIKAIESESNVKFDIYASKDTSNKKLKDWAFVESLVAKDKFEARKYRKIKRYPQYNYGVIVNFPKNEEPIVRVHYIHDEHNKNVALLSMKMVIVEDFIEYKGFETSDEVRDYIHKKEHEADAMYAFMKAQMQKSNGFDIDLLNGNLR